MQSSHWTTREVPENQNLWRSSHVWGFSLQSPRLWPPLPWTEPTPLTLSWNWLCRLIFTKWNTANKPKKKKMTSNTWHTILFPICPWAVAMKSTLRNSSKEYEKMRVVGVSSAHSSWLQKHHSQTSMKSFKHKSSWFCLWIWQVL